MFVKSYIIDTVKGAIGNMTYTYKVTKYINSDLISYIDKEESYGCMHRIYLKDREKNLIHIHFIDLEDFNKLTKGNKYKEEQ